MNTQNIYLDIIEEDKIKINQLRKQKIMPTEPIISFNGIPYIEANAITVIQGKAGAAKSRLAQMLCSHLIMSPNKHTPFGFIVHNVKDLHICYADTERNTITQCPRAVQNILYNAGYSRDTDINNLEFISILRIPRENRFQALKSYIENLKEKYKNKHILLILDVITDCISSFNDAQDSLQLIDMLNTLINESKISILAVIHENPGTDKARGHLGTELLNKASTQIQVGYAKEKDGVDSKVIEVKILKNRNVGKSNSLYYTIDEYGNLIPVNDDVIISLQKPKENKACVFQIMKELGNISNWPLSNAELVNLLMKKHNASNRTIESRLREIAVKELNIEKNNDYYLLIEDPDFSGRGKGWSILKRST